MPKAAAPGSRSSIPAPTASAQRRQNHPVTRSLIPWPHPPNRAPLIQTSLNLGIPPVSRALRLLVLRLMRSEEHTSELQSLMRISYAVFCLKKKTNTIHKSSTTQYNNRRNNEHELMNI